METTDHTLAAGMKREKDEEIGAANVISVLPNESYNILFRKKDGNVTICPHIPAVFKSGDIELNNEYSEYRWVDLEKLPEFEPKIAYITWLTDWAVHKLTVAAASDSTEI